LTEAGVGGRTNIEADGHLLLLAGRNAAAEGLATLREIPIQKLP